MANLKGMEPDEAKIVPFVTRVEKAFDLDGISTLFTGTVTSIEDGGADKKRTYVVTYEDGDTEKMGWQSLKKCLIPTEAQPSSTAKKDSFKGYHEELPQQDVSERKIPSEKRSQEIIELSLSSSDDETSSHNETFGGKELELSSSEDDHDSNDEKKGGNRVTPGREKAKKIHCTKSDAKDSLEQNELSMLSTDEESENDVLGAGMQESIDMELDDDDMIDETTTDSSNCRVSLSPASSAQLLQQNSPPLPVRPPPPPPPFDEYPEHRQERIIIEQQHLVVHEPTAGLSWVSGPEPQNKDLSNEVESSKFDSTHNLPVRHVFNLQSHQHDACNERHVQVSSSNLHQHSSMHLWQRSLASTQQRVVRGGDHNNVSQIPGLGLLSASKTREHPRVVSQNKQGSFGERQRRVESFTGSSSRVESLHGMVAKNKKALQKDEAFANLCFQDKYECAQILFLVQQSGGELLLASFKPKYKEFFGVDLLSPKGEKFGVFLTERYGLFVKILNPPSKQKVVRATPSYENLDFASLLPPQGFYSKITFHSAVGFEDISLCYKAIRVVQCFGLNSSTIDMGIFFDKYHSMYGEQLYKSSEIFVTLVGLFPGIFHVKKGLVSLTRIFKSTAILLEPFGNSYRALQALELRLAQPKMALGFRLLELVLGMTAGSGGKIPLKDLALRLSEVEVEAIGLPRGASETHLSSVLMRHFSGIFIISKPRNIFFVEVQDELKDVITSGKAFDAMLRSFMENSIHFNDKELQQQVLTARLITVVKGMKRELAVLCLQTVELLRRYPSGFKLAQLRKCYSKMFGRAFQSPDQQDRHKKLSDFVEEKFTDVLDVNIQRGSEAIIFLKSGFLDPVGMINFSEVLDGASHLNEKAQSNKRSTSHSKGNNTGRDVNPSLSQGLMVGDGESVKIIEYPSPKYGKASNLVIDLTSSNVSASNSNKDLKVPPITSQGKQHAVPSSADLKVSQSISPKAQCAILPQNGFPAALSFIGSKLIEGESIVSIKDELNGTSGHKYVEIRWTKLRICIPMTAVYHFGHRIRHAKNAPSFVAITLNDAMCIPDDFKKYVLPQPCMDRQDNWQGEKYILLVILEKDVEHFQKNAHLVFSKDAQKCYRPILDRPDATKHYCKAALKLQKKVFVKPDTKDTLVRLLREVESFSPELLGSTADEVAGFSSESDSGATHKHNRHQTDMDNKELQESRPVANKIVPKKGILKMPLTSCLDGFPRIPRPNQLPGDLLNESTHGNSSSPNGRKSVRFLESSPARQQKQEYPSKVYRKEISSLCQEGTSSPSSASSLLAQMGFNRPRSPLLRPAEPASNQEDTTPILLVDSVPERLHKKSVKRTPIDGKYATETFVFNGSEQNVLWQTATLKGGSKKGDESIGQQHHKKNGSIQLPDHSGGSQKQEVELDRVLPAPVARTRSRDNENCSQHLQLSVTRKQDNEEKKKTAVVIKLKQTPQRSLQGFGLEIEEYVNAKGRVLNILKAVQDDASLIVAGVTKVRKYFDNYGYYNGTVESIDSDSDCVVVYEDGDKETASKADIFPLVRNYERFLEETKKKNKGMKSSGPTNRGKGKGCPWQACAKCLAGKQSGWYCRLLAGIKGHTENSHDGQCWVSPPHFTEFKDMVYDTFQNSDIRKRAQIRYADYSIFREAKGSSFDGNAASDQQQARTFLQLQLQKELKRATEKHKLQVSGALRKRQKVDGLTAAERAQKPASFLKRKNASSLMDTQSSKSKKLKPSADHPHVTGGSGTLNTPGLDPTRREHSQMSYEEYLVCDKVTIGRLSQNRDSLSNRSYLESLRAIRGNKAQKDQENAMYGSVLPNFVEEMIKKVQITHQARFLDIGSGIGTVVVQVAATAGCYSAGIEVDGSRAALATAYKEEFLESSETHGLRKLIDLQHGSFLDFQDLPAAAPPKSKRARQSDPIDEDSRRSDSSGVSSDEEPDEEPSNYEVAQATVIFFNNASGWCSGEKENPERQKKARGKKLEDKMKGIGKEDKAAVSAVQGFCLGDELVRMVVNHCKIGTKLVALEQLINLKPGIFSPEKEYMSPAEGLSWSDKPIVVYIYTLDAKVWTCETCTFQEQNYFENEVCVGCGMKLRTQRQQNKNIQRPDGGS